MRNQVRSAWRALRGRRIFSLAAVGGIAALLLGTLGASTAIAHGIVTSGDIENQTIRGWDVHDQGLHGWEIADFSLHNWDIARDTIRENTLHPDLRQKINQSGEQGPPGEDGEDGQDGVSGYVVVGNEVTVPAGASNQTVQASCPDGKVALGGGHHAEGRGGQAVVVHQSAPTVVDPGPDEEVTTTGWTVRASNPSDQNAQVQAYVTCASVS